MRIALAISIIAWTFIAWGGRIGLLTSDEGWGSWVRIGGSLLIGVITAATLLVPRLEPARRSALVAFSVFTVIVWTRSLIVNWAGSGSMAFKLVHTALGLGFFALAAWSIWFVANSDAA